MKKSISWVQSVVGNMKTLRPFSFSWVALLVLSFVSTPSMNDIQAAVFPSNPSSEEDCATVLSANAESLYTWYTSRGAWIDRRHEYMTEECWQEYEYQSEEAKSTYDADLQVATVGLLGALAACERGVAAACFAAAVVEPGPALDAMCAAKVAACVSVAWATWYVAADMALIEFRNAMDTAYRTRDLCTDRTDALRNAMSEKHDSDYLTRWLQLQNEYQACVANVIK